MWLFLAIAAVQIFAVKLETTTHPHHTGHHHQIDNNELSTALFYYDGTSHSLVLRIMDDRCYIMKLSDSQTHLVHTKEGMASLEILLMGSLDRNPHALDSAHLQHFGLHIRNMCTGTSYLVHTNTHHTTPVPQPIG